MKTYGFVVILLSLAPYALGSSELSFNQKNKNSLKVEVAVEAWEADAEWSTAIDISGLQVPNPLSVLEFDNVESTPVSINAEYEFQVFRSYFLIGAHYKTGDITKGEVTDSDFDSDQEEYSISISDSVGDDLSETDIYFGWRQQIDDWRVTLLAGYQTNEQSFRIQNPRQIICTSPCTVPLDENSGLNSVYAMDWSGPWLGFELSENRGKHTLSLRYEYHFDIEYEAEAEWSLNTDLQQPRSFIHRADATANEIRLNYRYQVNQGLEFSMYYGFSKWESDPGVETRFFSDNSVGQTRMNGAEIEAQSIGVGIQYRF